jgi:hypothetical protein
MPIEYILPDGEGFQHGFGSRNARRLQPAAYRMQKHSCLTFTSLYGPAS